jgi:hypothetical protein
MSKCSPSRLKKNIELSSAVRTTKETMGGGIYGWCGYLPHIVNSSLVEFSGFYTALNKGGCALNRRS